MEEAWGEKPQQKGVTPVRVFTAISAIECQLDADDEEGGILLTLTFEFTDGSKQEVTKKLTKPCFRIDLNHGDTEKVEKGN